MLLMLVTACTAAPTPTPEPTPEPITITGTFTLHHERGWADTTCRGSDGYGDIMAGMNMTLRDEDGTVIGTDTFGVGRTQDKTQCVFDFEFADVPEAEFYTIDSGRRGELSYSRAELEATGWRVAFTLGP